MRAAEPANGAGPVLRAGFTEVLVTGMLTKWIRVRHRPMARGAKPEGARFSVTPMITNKKIMMTPCTVNMALYVCGCMMVGPMVSCSRRMR